MVYLVFINNHNNSNANDIKNNNDYNNHDNIHNLVARQYIMDRRKGVNSQRLATLPCQAG